MRFASTVTPFALALLVAIAGGCTSTHVPPPGDSTAGDGGDVATGSSTVVGMPPGAAQPPAAGQPAASPADSGATEELRRLEREAAALARTAGCEQGGDCRTAPVGDRPCGGPRYYLVYCARTTDSVALFRKLGELSRAERAYNERTGLASTCEFRMPPEVVASGGSCRAVP